MDQYMNYDIFYMMYRSMLISFFLNFNNYFFTEHNEDLNKYNYYYVFQ